MSVVIRISGKQTIQEAEQTKQVLLASFQESNEIALDCGDIEEVDLTFIQLIMAARKSAEQSGKTLTLITETDSALLMALDDVGIWPEPGQRFWFERRARS